MASKIELLEIQQALIDSGKIFDSVAISVIADDDKQLDGQHGLLISRHRHNQHERVYAEVLLKVPVVVKMTPVSGSLTSGCIQGSVRRTVTLVRIVVNNGSVKMLGPWKEVNESFLDYEVKQLFKKANKIRMRVQ